VAVVLKPVLDNRKEVVRRLLGTFYTSLEGNIISTSKAIVLARGELEAKVDLLIRGTLKRKNLFKIDLSIYSLGIMDYLFKTNLPSIFVCFLKLGI
jgi:hypothetical protein